MPTARTNPADLLEHRLETRVATRRDATYPRDRAYRRSDFPRLCAGGEVLRTR